MTTFDSQKTAMSAADDSGGIEFERHRRYLTGLAYRMLGSLAEAEDVVQEAYIRWHRTEKGAVESVRALLSKTVTRLCLDQLRSARAQRETYVGPWLPEPVLNAETLSAGTASEYAADLSVGLMLALERLSPLERAAFLLHDVFDVDFGEIARLLGRHETACRKLATRARAHVCDSRSRFEIAPEKGSEILQAFMGAYRTGDIDGLAGLLADDAVLHTDGGGNRKAALNPIYGKDRVLRLFEGVTRKFPDRIADVRQASINGLPGCVVTFADGHVQTIALEIVGQEIRAVYAVVNPDKLKHISAVPAGRA